MGIGDGRRMQPRRHQAGNVRDVHHQISTHLVRNLTKPLEVNRPRIRAGTRHDQLRTALQRNPAHFVVINKSFVIDAIRIHLKIFSGHVGRASVREMTAMGQIHAKHLISRLQHSKKDRHIGLCTRMGLHIYILTAKDLFRSCNSQILHHVHTLAAAVISLSGITFRILIGQRAAHGRHHRFTYPVL